MMLKRKVNPSASKIYMDESINAFRIEATRSNIVASDINDSLSRCSLVKPGENFPRFDISMNVTLWDQSRFPCLKVGDTVVNGSDW